LNPENQPKIHQAIEAWSKTYTSQEILEKVQDYSINRRGPGTVATAKMADVKEDFEDQNWWERGVFDKGTDPYYGELALQAPVWKMTGTPGRIKWVCRPVGADNEFVYKKYLGIGKTQLQEWKSRNIV
jgi:crotonobetainyl-CoA:carnitine CoA-transferase CaiB-like acyl-CoA transferase